MENMKSAKNLKSAYFAGGCFWCLDPIFFHFKGVEQVEVGYAGGTTVTPSYEAVSSGKTGHAETVKIDYDPSVIAYADLLRIFFTIHNPTTLNRQGADVGTQYRSVVFYQNDDEKKIIKEIIEETDTAKVYDAPIVTQVAPLENFYRAEEYHQKYFEKNPEAAYCQLVVAPKVAKFRQKYADLYK
jgi:peptide-methionine (S)-S-oxide reductase